MNWTTSLRREIINYARQYAEHKSIPFYLSRAQKFPTVMFTPYNGGTQHGSFLTPSYQAILARQNWKVRLQKRHPRLNALPPERRNQAKELDSCNSSDALLMNIFCYPGIKRCRRLASLFDQSVLPPAEFGVRARNPFTDGRADRTEVDMRLGGTLVEAKLTEPDFTSKSKTHVQTYRDFEGVFDAAMLPQSERRFFNYQLIRNVLAAFAHDAVFILVCDGRRPDLLRSWWNVMRAVKSPEMRSRCGFVLWQEIADVVPDEIRGFLMEKYGIVGTREDVM